MVGYAQLNRNINRWVIKSQGDCIKYWAKQTNMLTRKLLRFKKDPKKHARPGKPPFTHPQLNKDGSKSKRVNMKWIKHDVNVDRLSAVVGPIKANRAEAGQSAKTVPERLETGGSVKYKGKEKNTRKRKRGWGSTYTQQGLAARAAVFQHKLRSGTNHYGRRSILVDDQGNLEYPVGAASRATRHVINPPHPYISVAHKRIAPRAKRYLRDFMKANGSQARWRPKNIKLTVAQLKSDGLL